MVVLFPDASSVIKSCYYREKLPRRKLQSDFMKTGRKSAPGGLWAVLSFRYVTVLMVMDNHPWRKSIQVQATEAAVSPGLDPTA